MGRGTREEWAKRVERWRDSDLTAAEFAAETGINPKTLAYWKWRLKGAEKRTERGGAPLKAVRPRFVEVTGPAAAALRSVTAPSASEPTGSRGTTPRFEPIEILVREGLRIREPSSFDPALLRKVVEVLEAL